MRLKSIFFIFFLFFIFTLSSFAVVAHQSHEGGNKEQEEKDKENAAKAKAIEILASSYNKDIRPIFETKCFNCHSNQTQYPWYHSLPFVKGLIDSDIQEALKHLDMTLGFPFQGHGTLPEDLKAIKEVAEDNSMPPWSYRIMHWGSGLSKEEKNAIFKWVDESQKKLNFNLN